MSEYYTQTHILTGDEEYDYHAVGDVCIQGTRLYISEPSIYYMGTFIQPAVNVYDLDESTNQWSLTTGISANPVTTGIVQFGEKIDAHDSQLVIVGKHYSDQDSTGAPDLTFVQIYNQQTSNTWSLTQTISTTDTNSTSGSDVSIYGDTLIVGDAEYDNEQGRVLVYTKSGSTWSYSTVITASDAADEDRFGASVSLDQDTLAIGAFYEDNNSLTNNGCVYIFTRSGNSWTQSTKIYPDDSIDNHNFGTSVGLSGTRLVVGATGDDDVQSGAGAVYIFDLQSEWTQTAKISGFVSENYNLSNFGRSVDTDGARLVASREVFNPFGSGDAIIYTLSGGTSVAQASGDPHMVTFGGTRYTL